MHTFYIIHHALCSMHIYAHTHTHIHMHTVPKYGTCNITLCMYAWSGLLDSVSGWEQGTSGKRKKRCKRISRCILHSLHCTALHGLALHGRVVVSPRLAWPRIASLRPVKLIPTSYLYFLGGSAGQSPRRLLTLHYLYVA